MAKSLSDASHGHRTSGLSELRKLLNGCVDVPVSSESRVDANEDGSFSGRMSGMAFATLAAGLSVAYAWNRSLRRYVRKAIAEGRGAV